MMKNGTVKYAALLLVLVLLWRMLGAPVTAQDFADLQTPLWQARVLLPSRAARVLRLWPVAAQTPENLSRIPFGVREVDGEEEGAIPSSMTLSVYDDEAGELVTMPLEQYVCCVVAAEMPASYHMEALKAQAVAARTRAVQQSAAYLGGGCKKHGGADVCTDSAHCQGFASVETCRQKWGDSYDAYASRVEQAVRDTSGQILTYDGVPITVFYHAISGGYTEDAQTVFSQSLPYAVSVESSGEEEAKGFYEDDTFTLEDASKRLQAAFPNLSVTPDALQTDFAISTYTPTGRVDTLMLAGSEVSAIDVRKALGLRSTWFTLSMSGDSITFQQRGYGHGVGMSQAGANHMAAQGDDYREILAHYYQGTALAMVADPAQGT